MEKFKYGRRKLGNRNNWEDLERPYLLPDKPVVFIFGGNLTLTTHEANGYAKLIGNSFRNFTSSTADIISVSYEGEIAEMKGKDIVLSKRAERNVIEFFDTTIYDDLRSASTEQDIRNVLKNMIFIGHSAGVNVINSIMQCAENFLLYRFNEDKERVDDVMSEIKCFCYAPGVPIKSNV